MDSKPRIAFVQDALPFRGGAEKVLETALQIFPDAPVFTLVYQAGAFQGTPIEKALVRPSFIDRLPGAREHHRWYFPVMPLAIEQLDLQGFDVIVSLSYAVAHGIRPHPHQLHISYIHTPLRYAYQLARDEEAIPGMPAMQWAARIFLRSFRRWDRAASKRTHHFVTVSSWMAGWVRQAYGRDADVLYPPVDIDRFHAAFPRQDFYITVSRLVRHKRIDLMIEAFNRMGLPLVIIGEGPEKGNLQRMAAGNIHFLGWQDDERVAGWLGKAKAFVHAGVEDFGIAMVEAQAAGTPVIALGRGAAPEIVRSGLTGELFQDQSSRSLEAAVADFETRSHKYDPRICRENAGRFSRARFLEGFSQLVQMDWDRFQQSQRRNTEEDFEVLGKDPGYGSESIHAKP